MKKIFVSAMLLTGTLATHADDYTYLTFQTSSGTAQSVSIESLVITFSDGQLTAANSKGTQTLSLSSLSKMFFSAKDDTTAIQTVETDTDTVEVFSLNGRSIGRYANVTEAKSILKTGIYVFKSKNETAKIAVK